MPIHKVPYPQRRCNESLKWCCRVNSAGFGEQLGEKTKGHLVVASTTQSTWLVVGDGVHVICQCCILNASNCIFKFVSRSFLLTILQELITKSHCHNIGEGHLTTGCSLESLCHLLQINLHLFLLVTPVAKWHDDDGTMRRLLQRALSSWCQIRPPNTILHTSRQQRLQLLLIVIIHARESWSIHQEHVWGPKPPKPWGTNRNAKAVQDNCLLLFAGRCHIHLVIQLQITTEASKQMVEMGSLAMMLSSHNKNPWNSFGLCKGFQVVLLEMTHALSEIFLGLLFRKFIIPSHLFFDGITQQIVLCGPQSNFHHPGFVQWKLFRMDPFQCALVHNFQLNEVIRFDAWSFEVKVTNLDVKVAIATICLPTDLQTLVCSHLYFKTHGFSWSFCWDDGHGYTATRTPICSNHWDHCGCR